jgi:hypothetical protein
MGLAVSLRGGSLTSFDIADQRLTRVKQVWAALGPSRMRLALVDLEDVERPSPEVIDALFKADILFNDGWDKDLESAIYAKYLPIGAGVLQHDYTYDHTRPQVGYSVLEDLGFEPRYETIAVHLNSCARFWVRTGGGVNKDRAIEVDSRGKASVEARSTMQNIDGDSSRSLSRSQTHQQQDVEQAFIQFAMLNDIGYKLLQQWRRQQSYGQQRENQGDEQTFTQFVAVQASGQELLQNWDIEMSRRRR